MCVRQRGWSSLDLAFRGWDKGCLTRPQLENPRDYWSTRRPSPPCPPWRRDCVGSITTARNSIVRYMVEGKSAVEVGCCDPAAIEIDDPRGEPALGGNRAYQV